MNELFTISLHISTGNLANYNFSNSHDKITCAGTRDAETVLYDTGSGAVHLKGTNVIIVSCSTPWHTPLIGASVLRDKF